MVNRANFVSVFPKAFHLPGAGSSPKDVLAEGAPKNWSLRRDSGTGLTMNLRPAECTTCAVVLGEIPDRNIRKKNIRGRRILQLVLTPNILNQACLAASGETAQAVVGHSSVKRQEIKAWIYRSLDLGLE